MTKTNDKTMPQYFAKHGYHTQSLGKIFHIGHGNPQSFREPHFHEKVIEYVDIFPTLAELADTAEYELYDYETDPLETESLAGKHPDIVAMLKAKLAKYAEPVDPRRPTKAAPKKGLETR